MAPIVSTLEALPGALPSQPIPATVDAQAAVAGVVARLEQLTASDFAADAFLRDQFALTGNLRTFYTPEAILSVWQDLTAAKKTSNFRVVPQSSRVAGTWLEGRFEFDAEGPPAVTCSGILYLVPADEAATQWRIWQLCTILENIVGHEHVDLREHPEGAPLLAAPKANGTNGVNGHATNGASSKEELYDCVIVGGGQSGLATAGWMKSLGLKYLVVERNAHIGDNWTSRYTSAKLHTTQRFNDLPFGPTFTDADPQFLPTKSLAAGYQRYAKQFGINIWLSAHLEAPATWSNDSRRWSMSVQYQGSSHALDAKHIVLATGPGGTVPTIPVYPGKEDFKGTWLHSVDYKEPAKDWAGKNVIVVGTANTGHDVAEDALLAGAKVTMVQRSSTYVVPREYFIKLFDLVWNDSIPQELSDRFFWAPPAGVSRHMVSGFLNSLVDADSEFFDRLEATGFRVDRKADFLDHLLIRFGGHYMNCGVSEMIADGKIQIKNDAPIERFDGTGLAFTNGSHLDADIVIFATGFEKDIKSSAAPVVGGEVVGQLHQYWGVDSEGEVSGAFKPCGHPGLWLTGGGCAHARYFTRFVALQVLADLLGQPLSTE